MSRCICPVCLAAHESTAPRLQVGDTLYGFCGGHFGRDSYGEKYVEAIGPDWVVARERIMFADSKYRNVALFAHVESPDDLCEYRTEPEDPYG